MNNDTTGDVIDGILAASLGLAGGALLLIFVFAIADMILTYGILAILSLLFVIIVASIIAIPTYHRLVESSKN